MKQISYANFFVKTPEPFVNKKLLKQINLDIKHLSGIYKITNTITGDCYIGKAKDVFIRIGQHKSLLRSNKHKYRNGDLSMLQKAWNKYGEDSFEFEIIEICLIDELDKREKYWIDYYQCNCSKTRHGYNTTDGGEGAYGNQNVKGRIHIHNNEIHKMIYPDELEEYEKQGFVKGLPQELIEKFNQNKNVKYGEEHWAFGRNISEEHKKKISDANKGKTSWMKGKHWDDEHKEMLRISSTGKRHTEESKRKISESKQKSVVQYDKNNEKISEYVSAVEAENKTGIGRSHISQCCNGKRKSAGGYIWRFKNE